MGNHVQTTPTITTRMYLTPDGKFVVNETVITDKRPLKYYTEQLLKEVLKR